jgi:acetyl esterase/lipase
MSTDRPFVSRWAVVSALAAALALGGGLQAQVAVAQVPVADGVFNGDTYPQAKVSFPGGVTGLPDLTYTTAGGYRRLKLDLYLPPGPTTGARPVIVYMHGGGWSGGTPRTTGAFENWPEVLASFAARGYVVASIHYRLSGEAPYPAAIQDAKAAVRWLRTNATTYGIDTNRFVSWGVSAGGQLAGLLATSCNVAELEPPAAAGRGGRGGGRGGARGAGAPAAGAASRTPSGTAVRLRAGFRAVVRRVQPGDVVCDASSERRRGCAGD